MGGSRRSRQASKTGAPRGAVLQATARVREWGCGCEHKAAVTGPPLGGTVGTGDGRVADPGIHDGPRQYEHGRLGRRMERTVMARRALRLEWVSIGWMIIEAAGALWAGVQAHSVSLTGFGADSLIELLSASILVQRLTIQVRGGDDDRVEKAEHGAARWAAGLLGVLVVYLIGAAGWELFGHLREAPSPLGTVLAAVSAVLMFWIARSKRVLGQALGSAAVQADAAESVVCAGMAVTALISLVANWAIHWTWVDPIAALVIAYWVAREAREAWAEAHEA